MTLNVAKRSNRVTALLEYLNSALITCSLFSHYNSVVFNLISSQSLTGSSTLIIAHEFQF